MRIWTFKDQSQYESLMNNSILFGELKYIQKEWEEFIPSYNWMKNKIPNNQDGEYPIWAWNKKPKLTHHLFENYKNTGDYLIELEVPDDQCLVSCFSNWHCVLNDVVLCRDNIFELYEKLEKINKSKYDKLKLRSWDRIFLEKWQNKKGYLQVCIAKIDKSQIVNVEKCGDKIEKI